MQDELQQKLDGIKTNINELLLNTVEIEEEIKLIKDNKILDNENWMPKGGKSYWYIDFEEAIEMTTVEKVIAVREKKLKKIEEMTRRLSFEPGYAPIIKRAKRDLIELDEIEALVKKGVV